MRTNCLLIIALVGVSALWAGAQVCELDWSHEIGKPVDHLACKHVEMSILRNGVLISWYPDGWGGPKETGGWPRLTRAWLGMRFQDNFRLPRFKATTVNGQTNYDIGLPFIVLALPPTAWLALRIYRRRPRNPRGFAVAM